MVRSATTREIARQDIERMAHDVGKLDHRRDFFELFGKPHCPLLALSGLRPTTLWTFLRVFFRELVVILFIQIHHLVSFKVIQKNFPMQLSSKKRVVLDFPTNRFPGPAQS